MDNKIPRATKFPGIYSDKFPSFDTFDQMQEYAKNQGATHIHFSNYHDGAFIRANNPDQENSRGTFLRFHCRYDWAGGTYEKNPNGYTPLGNQEGWFCHEHWQRSCEPFSLKPGCFYTFLLIPVDYKGNDPEILRYYLNVKKIHDYYI